jgi:hypothetical protein
LRGFKVWGLGFGVWGLGFGVCGFGFRLARTGSWKDRDDDALLLILEP